MLKEKESVILDNPPQNSILGETQVLLTPSKKQMLLFSRKPTTACSVTLINHNKA
jgi:hypothetical protein